MKFKNIFNGLAAFSAAAMALVSCNDGLEKTNTLSVDPSSAIEFLASGNDDVTLKVTTDADEWAFTAPEWIEANKGDNTLIINAKENTTSDELLGRITFTAGNAEPVKIMVSQAAKGNGGTDGVKGQFNCVEDNTTIFVKSETNVSASVNVSFESAVTKDVVLSVSVDPEYLAEYNYLNGESHELFPVDKVTVEGKLTAKAGETQTNTLTVALDASEIEFGTGYLVPLVVKVESGAATVNGDDSRVNLVVMKSNPKPIKNVLYFEVNDTNPLNALEYKMSDGSYFFDAVILFAANINYNSVDDVVYLHNNPNVQALLDESDVYIQPLRKAGMKVYLGLLGNHDAAGLCQLSDWGAKEWAKEVAQACKEYKLDGVNLDDEYSGYPDGTNKWFTSVASAAAGSRLMYELKKEMKRVCSWPTEVSYFQWGSLYTATSVTDQETKEEYTPSNFVDFYVANYGGKSSPFSDMTYANCSFMSVECNLGRGYVTESDARQAKEQGYGWCMWFAFDPSGTGGINANLNRVKGYMQAFAKGCYDCDLVEPTGVYHKRGEGDYDPKRYDL